MNPTERRAVLRMNNGGFVPSSDAFASESHVRLSSEVGHTVSILATPADHLPKFGRIRNHQSANRREFSIF